MNHIRIWRFHISIIWSESNWRFPSWGLSWILDWCEWSLLRSLLLNRLRLLLLFLVVGGPWWISADRVVVVLISLANLISNILICLSSYFSWVAPSVILSRSIIMGKTKVTGSSWLVMNFNRSLTLVVLRKFHICLILFIIVF